MIDRARRDNRGPAELDAELLREVQARPGVRACSCALDCAQATANTLYRVRQNLLVTCGKHNLSDRFWSAPILRPSALICPRPRKVHASCMHTHRAVFFPITA
jgi:hypothetical protein